MTSRRRPGSTRHPAWEERWIPACAGMTLGWGPCSPASVLARNAQATTAQGALAQAWVSWLYRGSFEIGDRPRIRELVACADFAALDAMGDDLDMVHRLQLRVIRTLRVLAGEALS